jgi:MFS transporter, NNP family, nitrate/nitrite transporter
LRYVSNSARPNPKNIPQANFASLIIRVISGPLCDRFGSRVVFGSLILIGCIPIGLSPLVHDANGLYVARFFIGVLGATFVPCQVWCTGFFDKNIVGTANALAGGWGNAGGGITYFIMPAVYDSFISMGHSPSQSWRLTFIVPLIFLISVAIGLLTLCPDTPMGKWSERHLHVQENLNSHGVIESVVDVPGGITDKAATHSGDEEKHSNASEKQPDVFDHEVSISRTEMVETAKGETVVAPTFKEAMKVVFSLQTLFHCSTYFCSFGGELAINAILSSYYLKNFPSLGQTGSSNWAAMFGFLNVVTRPIGGVIGDVVYSYTGRNLWAKKIWVTICGIVTGVLLVIIGKDDPHDLGTMIGLIFLMACFLEAGNGANFALVPHVHPFANGIVSGLTGAAGNMGGVAFAVIFRFMDGGSGYAHGIWIIGCIHIAISVLVSWIPPLPKGQIGGK